MLALLNDAPVVPGDNKLPYEHGAQARQILNDAEDDLRDWQPETEITGQEPTRQVAKEDSLDSAEGIPAAQGTAPAQAGVTA